MKRIISIISFTVIVTALAVALLTACGPSQAEIDESIALESAQARLAEAEAESESIAESVAAVKESIAAEEESIAAKKNRPANYTPTDEQKELICGDWYRSKDDGEGDMDFYWLTMDDKGYCTFAHETRNSDGYIDDLEGTWTVDDHGFVNIDLGKYAGKFRFLKNAYGSTNIICQDGDDFVESGEEGEYAAFVPVKWYQGMLRFVDKKELEDETASGVALPDSASSNAASSDASSSDATASEAKMRDMTYIEMQGDGDKWFPLAAVTDYCKIDVDTKDEEVLGRIAINQNDHLVVKIQQIR